MAAPGQAGDPVDQGWGLLSPMPVEVAGEAEFSAVSGALTVRPEELSGIHLRAEEILIRMDWERGYRTRGHPAAGNFITDSGRETIHLVHADVVFDRFQADPVFMAFGDTLDLETKTWEGFRMTPRLDPVVGGAGSSEEAVEAGDPEDPSFWHQIQGPVIETAGQAQAQAKGDFTLFPHNAEIHAEGDGERWSDWTGRSETGADRPVAEYEFRITRIQVTNGTFLTMTEDLALFSPTIDGFIEGSVTAPNATGRLLDNERILEFHDSPITLEGTGSLTMAATGPGGETDVALLMDPGNGFKVNGARFSAPFSPRSSDDWWDSSVIVATGLLVVALAAAGTFGATRRPRARFWMGWATRAHRQGRYGWAAWYYRRAVRADRQDPLSWYKWARLELDRGNPSAADQIAVKAEKVPGIDLLDLLEVRAFAAWDQDDHGSFQGLLKRIASVSPDMAKALLQDLRIDRTLLDPELQGIMTISEDQEGPIDGYA